MWPPTMDLRPPRMPWVMVGPDDDAADDAEVLADAVAFDGEGGGDGHMLRGKGEGRHG